MTDQPSPTQIAPKARSASIVRLIVDWGGPACFLVGYLIARRTAPASDHQHAILVATWALVAGSVATLLLGLIVERRVAPVPAFAGAVALVFGTLTLVFHDPRFIYVKPTVINVVLGAVMLGGVAMGKNPLKVLINDAVQLPDAAWRRLTIRYGVFFLCVAALNEAVWRTQPEQTWVLFRMPGLLILTLLFSLSQVPAIMKDARGMEAAAELEG